jgi:hypothetical protein
MCETKAALAEAWSTATRQLSDATNAMTFDRIGRMSKEDYVVLRSQAEQARLASENARVLLQLHREEHGC